MSVPLRVLLTGGGSGGHVYPALSVVDTVGIIEVGAQFRYVGTERGLERGIVSATSVPFDSILAGAFRGRSPVALVSSLGRNARGLVQAGRIVRSFRPHVVLATGGFVCVPVVLAARMLSVPSVIYLPDLRPGWAVRFLARIATAVAISFDEVRPFVPARRVEVTGYPVRPGFADWSRETARQNLGLLDDLPVVLVLGGSQGAQSINDAVVGDAARLLEKATVLHATGPTHYDAIASRLASLPSHMRERYRLYPYLGSELTTAMVASSVIVSRAGASTLGEIPAAGSVGVLVPYPHAGAHQNLNADFLARHGAALVVEDQDARTGGLVPIVLDLLANTDRRAGMAEASRRLARPHAAQRIFELLADVAGKRTNVVRGGSVA